jgi:DNA-binding transcriptional regulator YiaG
VAGLRATAAHWSRLVAREPWRPAVSDAELKAARLSAGLIRKLRTRLRLTQATLARLVGVSAAAVVQWERGRSSPAAANRGALIALRRVGRRDVKALLARVPEQPAPGGRGPQRRRRARGRRGTGSRRR